MILLTDQSGVQVRVAALHVTRIVPQASGGCDVYTLAVGGAPGVVPARLFVKESADDVSRQREVVLDRWIRRVVDVVRGRNRDHDPEQHPPIRDALGRP